MKQLILLACVAFLSSTIAVTVESKEKPVQHLKIADVESMGKAKEIFIDSTAKIRGLKAAGPAQASQIHIITYSLEKSVAYFVQNLNGDRQALAKDIAVVVEDIHIASENNRQGKLKEHLANYFNLVDQFLFCF